MNVTQITRVRLIGEWLKSGRARAGYAVGWTCAGSSHCLRLSCPA